MTSRELILGARNGLEIVSESGLQCYRLIEAHVHGELDVGRGDRLVLTIAKPGLQGAKDGDADVIVEASRVTLGISA